MKWISIILLLSGCASEPSYIDSAFIFYTEQFASKFAVDDHQVSMLFGTISKNNVAAECNARDWAHKKAIVVVDRKTWFALSNERRKALVFHELGHCMLGLPHSPNGMMAPSI